ncbi:hypothetical protein [Nitrospirillum iridis]|uniref:DUF927 domain-containing protein n=1 Tax=Nitrospirillum iridis TaxID=765888 RepID=A0A7X0ECS8_9PROT|nr:hypothetical protein [Nitrospirillum iridis]MBB6251415.1 hypothetical protein [Nitrospirillum iridis]
MTEVAEKLTPEMAGVVVALANPKARLSRIPGGGAYRLVILGSAAGQSMVEASVGDAIIKAGLADAVTGAPTEATAAAQDEARKVMGAVTGGGAKTGKRKRKADDSGGAGAGGDGPPPSPFEAALAEAKEYVPADGDDGGVGGGGRRGLLPEDCPVTPLGNSGGIHYYLDAQRQFRELLDREHGKASLLGLFTPRHGWLYAHYPRYAKEGGAVTGWRAEAVAEHLMASNAQRGLWTPRDHVRGAGAWTDEHGQLILHLGNLVVMGGEAQRPGLLGDMVYPSAEPLFGPRKEPWPGDGSAAAELLRLLKQWNWKRKEGDLDARLMLGWIVAALLGGALRFRPVVWLTGDKGTGKSTLQDDILDHVMGRWLFRAADASAASIYQTKGQAALGVALDELEPEPHNGQRIQAVIKLARIAASGGKLRRGGKDGDPTEYAIRSCFMFSSILIPPLSSQDRSRLAVLELDQLPPGPPPKFDAAHLRDIGAGMLRAAVEGWGRLPDILQAYRTALAAQGHRGRGCDVFGTLLACSTLVLRGGIPTELDIRREVAELSAEHIAAQSGDMPDHEQCFHHLATHVADVYRGGTKRTIGQHIYTVAYGSSAVGAHDKVEAKQTLSLYGIRVILDREDQRPFLAIANSGSGIAAVFADTHWHAGEASQPGGWVQALRRFPDHEVTKNGISIGGSLTRATLLPLSVVLPEGQFFGAGWEDAAE